MRRLALLSFLFAFTASAEMWFEPLDPTTDDAVVLRVAERWPDGCLPINPVVTRNGNRVEVLWRVREGGCPLAETDWLDRVPLGMFDAGVYEVVPRVHLRGDRFRTYEPLTLIVRDRLPFSMSPMYASTRGGEITFAGAQFCSGTVRIDGVDVPYRRSGCAIVVTVPPHAAGRADITVRAEDLTTQTYRAVLRYVDPDAAPDPALVERVLVPILYDGAGAFGSRWVTEATVTLRQPVLAPFEWYRFRPCSSAQCGTAITKSFEPMSLSAMFGQRPNGLLLFVERNVFADNLYFGSIVRDVNNEGSFGAEVPIVREKNFRTGQTYLPNVTWGPRARATLRIYGVDGVLERIGVHVKARGKDWNSIYIERLPSPCAAVPCNSDQPAFIAIDLGTAFSRYAAANPGKIDVSVGTDEESNVHRYWAFVSVTHNETQNVTVITPQ